MSVFALQKSIDTGVWDIYVYKGHIARTPLSTMLNGVDADQITQAIATKLRTFMGEYYLDQTYGIPYYQTILQKGSDRAYFDAVVKTAILSIKGVYKLQTYTGSFNANNPRQYDISFSVLDANGIAISDTFTFGGS